MTVKRSKIKVLVVLANPHGTDPLRLGSEARAIQQSIALSHYRNKIVLTVLQAATIHDLRRALLNKEFHIIHISGHGTDKGLILENELGEPYLVPQAALSDLLRTYCPPIECIILNACYSVTQGKIGSMGVPYVIAMEGTVNDETAIEFFRGFYDALGAGKDYEFSYGEGCRAVNLSFENVAFISKIFKNVTTPQIAEPQLINVTSEAPALSPNSMANHHSSAMKAIAAHLWITYAWADNAEGDFDYLVSALKSGGIPSKYDRIALVPGQRLWDQIAQNISTGDLAGWAYLLTPLSIASQACREELAYALDRALSTKGADFPLIGLISDLPISDVPMALRIRLCVDLASVDWLEAVRAGLERRPPLTKSSVAPNFKTRVHNAYLGNPSLKAVEFVTRFGDLRYWRIAYPRNGPEAVVRGVGPAGGGRVSAVIREFVEGTVDINGISMIFFGSGDPISPSTGAYVAFQGLFPANIAFGWANEPTGVPTQWWPLNVA